MNSPIKQSAAVVHLVVTDEEHDRRLDKVLFDACPDVPKTHVYRWVRTGQVRNNGKRATIDTRVTLGDAIRIPPHGQPHVNATVVNATKQAEPLKQQAQRLSSPPPAAHWQSWFARMPVVFEDATMLVLNKPAGLAVHGGSGQSWGVIELLRAAYAAQTVGAAPDLELVHRLDKDTSGLLVVAKKRSALRALQQQIREKLWVKVYQALVLGAWPKSLQQVDLPLLKLDGNEHEVKVKVSKEGKPSSTRFAILGSYDGFPKSSKTSKPSETKPMPNALTLVRARLLTGRTHQIRVHVAASGFPIAGDERYGEFEYNKILQSQGLKRLFLHAHQLTLRHPVSGEKLSLTAPLADDLSQFLERLHKSAKPV